MPNQAFSRRDFSRTAITSLAAAFAMPHLQPLTQDRHAVPAPEGAIRINFNENNYGPSPKALEALANCGHIAARYPFTSSIQMIAALSKATGAKPENIILVDEAYFDFVDDSSFASALDMIPAHPNVVVARTFSKIHGLAGMRLGYAVGSKETVDAMRPFLDQENSNAAVLAAGLASLSDVENVSACRAKFIATRNWLCGELKKDGRGYTASQANFLMIDVGGDVQPVVDKFAQHKILVGRRFPSMSNWLRVSIGKQPEMETFLAALREIVPAGGAKSA